MKNKLISKESKNKFTFTAPLATLEGSYVESGIFLPAELIVQLPAKRLRANGTVNDIPFSLAIQYRKSGHRFFMINKNLVKTAGLKVGKVAHVNFTLVDVDELVLAEELEAVLEQDERANKVWNTFTRGLQRSLAHYVSSAKSVDSRIKRAIEMMEKAKAGTLTTQQRNKRN